MAASVTFATTPSGKPGKAFKAPSASCELQTWARTLGADVGRRRGARTWGADVGRGRGAQTWGAGASGVGGAGFRPRAWAAPRHPV